MQPILSRWNYLNRPELGLMNSISAIMHKIDKNHDSLPNIRSHSQILIGSDYSGQHKKSCYDSYGFIFANPISCQLWTNQIPLIRKKFLPDGRRVSYKNITESSRSRYLPSLLNLSNTISGAIIVINIHKDVVTLFQEINFNTPNEEVAAIKSNWSPKIFEKALRIVHFLCFFLAGFSTKNQDVLWITDEDDIVSNIKKHRALCTMLNNVGSNYIPHQLRNIRIATTASDTGKRDVEDLVALPDIAAGALCDLLNCYSDENIDIPHRLTIPFSKKTKQKSCNILSWLSEEYHPLKRIFFSLVPQKGGPGIVIKHIRLSQENGTILTFPK